MSKDCTIHRAYIHHKKGDGLVCFYFPPVSLKCTFWWEIYHHLECHDHNDMMGFGKSSISHGWNVGPLPLSEPRKVGMYFPHLNLSLGNPGCETRTYVEYIGNEVWLSDSCCQCQCLTQSHCMSHRKPWSVLLVVKISFNPGWNKIALITPRDICPD